MTDDSVTSQLLAPTDTDPETVPLALGPFHDFWCFREGERDYVEHSDLYGRQDVPVRLPMDMFDYLRQTWSWVATINPDSLELQRGHGMNSYGTTVIDREGGEAFAQICEGWARIFAQAPEMLVLTHGMYSVEGEQSERFHWHQFKTGRDKLVADLLLLADFGRKAATGEWFVLHLGI
ncbi:MAG: hypothetical protein H7Y38_01080 [Armatimonadetes bacterium]|nr:hypothetical protein [Armatimonadota bacterium]